jgi:hypothetical protein
MYLPGLGPGFRAIEGYEHCVEVFKHVRHEGKTRSLYYIRTFKGHLYFKLLAYHLILRLRNCG